jgi:hypothetical protein
VVDLEHRLGDYAELAAMEQALLAGEADESEKRLRSLERHLRTAIAAIGPIETELAQMIQATIRSIRFPRAVAEVGARSTGLFQQIADDYSESDDISHDKVQDLKRNYTMAHERAVHESTIGPPVSKDVEPPMEPVAPGEGLEDRPPRQELFLFEETVTLQTPNETDGDTEKLADNVELF